MPDHASTPSRARVGWKVPLLIGLLAFACRAWAPGPVTQTTDEVTWLKRSDRFRTAITEADFANATAGRADAVSTMPGVTTMWAGTLGRWTAEVVHDLGLANPIDPRSEADATVLRASRTIVALLTAAAIAAIVAFAGVVIGLRAAAVAGVLLATEPFLVGHSFILHTDAMVTTFGAASVVAMLAARQLGKRRLAHFAHHPPEGAQVLLPLRWAPGPALASGVFGGLALLSKSNAVVITVGGAFLVLAASMVDAVTSGGVVDEDGTLIRPTATGEIVDFVRGGLLWLGATALTVVVLWPALWVAPSSQLTQLRSSLRQVGSPNLTFFEGVTTQDPGPTFYPVTMAYRFTPWLLAGTVAAVLCIAVALLVPRLRKLLVGDVPTWVLHILLVAPALYLAAVTVAAKKFDRYVLPAVPFMALLIGVVVTALWDHATAPVGAHARPSRLAPLRRVAAGLVVVALSTYTFTLAPYAVSYVNPLLGQERAQHDILLGWGEGVEQMGQEVVRLEGDRCRRAVVGSWPGLRIALPCVRIKGMRGFTGLGSYDYVVIYVSYRQRGATRVVEEHLAQAGTLVSEFRIDGVPYAELWRVDHDRVTEEPSDG